MKASHGSASAVQDGASRAFRDPVGRALSQSQTLRAVRQALSGGGGTALRGNHGVLGTEEAPEQPGPDGLFLIVCGGANDRPGKGCHGKAGVCSQLGSAAGVVHSGRLAVERGHARFVEDCGFEREPRWSTARWSRCCVEPTGDGRPGVSGRQFASELAGFYEERLMGLGPRRGRVTQRRARPVRGRC